MDLLPPLKRQSPKSGNRPDECEDAGRVVYPIRLSQDGARIIRFALADGASESAFSRLWAQVLTGHFVHRPPDFSQLTPDYLEDWLAPCQSEWNRGIPWERIPWHGEAKTRAGALATLLGITFSRMLGQPRNLKWQAVAVGDSCLFLVRHNELVLSFPLDDARQFGNTPQLLCSNPANNRWDGDAIKLYEGVCQSEDMFILASDALAGWFLAQHAAGEKPWLTLLSFSLGWRERGERWEQWVNSQRQAGTMRNDDTTLIIARVR
jgi:hypothetical protein